MCKTKPKPAATLDQRPHFYAEDPRNFGRQRIKARSNFREWWDSKGRRRLLHVVVDSDYQVILHITPPVLFGNIWKGKQSVIALKGGRAARLSLL